MPTTSPGQLLGACSDARLVVLLSNSTSIGGYAISPTGGTQSVRVFPSTSVVSSSSTATWIAAGVSDYLKMVQIVVTVSGGGYAYAYASAAGYTSTGGYTTATLTTAVVKTAYASKNSMGVVSSSSGNGYGIAKLRFSISAATSSPSYTPTLLPTIGKDKINSYPFELNLKH